MAGLGIKALYGTLCFIRQLLRAVDLGLYLLELFLEERELVFELFGSVQ
jgi:hypothetical protein